MSEDYKDIVDELYDWDYIIEQSQGKAHVVMLSGEVYREAAKAILELREAAADVIYMIRRSENHFVNDEEWENTLSKLAALTHEL